MRSSHRSDHLISAHSRRDVLKWTGAAALALVGWPKPGFSLTTRTRELSLYSINTGEKLNDAYMVNGRFQPDALQAFNHLLRDFRTDAVYPIDPTTLDILSALQAATECQAPMHVVSGYRSHRSNEARRRESRGVARNSFHLTGQAIDLFVPGCSLSDLRQAALSLGAGGVGYYPSSGFVHVDSGPVRRWGGRH
jgi:uncharacterized protein YcbK (DUF882 family)